MGVSGVGLVDDPHERVYGVYTAWPEMEGQVYECVLLG